jgi:uroporphyrinogen decarboxylase
MEEVIKEVPPTALAMGNIDPVSLFKDGTPEQMRHAVHELLDKMRPYPNFVLSSGCDTPPHTPMANIEAFFEVGSAGATGTNGTTGLRPSQQSQ